MTQSAYDKRCEEHSKKALDALTKIDALKQRDAASAMLAALKRVLDYAPSHDYSPSVMSRVNEAIAAAEAAGIKVQS